MNEKFMSIAVDEAKKAYLEGNVPVGAVIVNNDNVIALNHNIKNTSNISVYHAEILAIISACENLKTWYLNDCVMYVTLKPCDMCMSAIGESRVSKVYYLLDSNYSDNLSKNVSNINIQKIDDCFDYSSMISNFFENLR